jgi:hypothetical protein
MHAIIFWGGVGLMASVEVLKYPCGNGLGNCQAPCSTTCNGHKAVFIQQLPPYQTMHSPGDDNSALIVSCLKT